MFWGGFFKRAEKISGDADMEPGEQPERSNNDYMDAHAKDEDPIAREGANTENHGDSKWINDKGMS